MARFVRRKSTTDVVIHCAATPPSFNGGAKEIDQWHRQRGWNGIGYHWVIRRDGVVEAGRPEWAVGAHVAGQNSYSIGICLVGGVDSNGKPQNNFTESQRKSLIRLLRERGYLQYNVKGHRDYPGVAKACPSFDVKTWLERNHNALYEDESVFPDEEDGDPGVMKEEERLPDVYVSEALPTFWTIGSKFGFSDRDLIEANPHLDARSLKHKDPVYFPL